MPKAFFYVLIFAAICNLFWSGQSLGDDVEAWMKASKLAGEGTFESKYPSATAYRNPLSNLREESEKKHLVGDRLFDKKFSDDLNRPDYGLGPTYNHLSCIGCHAKDGRGALPIVPTTNPWTRLGTGAQIFLRISLKEDLKETPSAENNWGSPIPVPGFGLQLFHLGSFKLRADNPGSGLAEVWMKYDFSKFTYPDGTQVELRKPIFQIRSPYDETTPGSSRILAKDVQTSPRMTPPMIGLGLIEAIPKEDILNLAKRDLSAWGIHGKPNWVIDRQKELQKDPVPLSLGRFGLKANTPSVFHQSLGALNGDMGVTNFAFPKESIEGTELFEAFKQNWKPGIEASDEISQALVFYSQTLAVPSRRNVEDLQVLEGAKLFQTVGCTNCHHPSYKTGSHSISELSGQRIYPYSDFLLHDMGEGLADGRSDFRASGRDWKTRALWGIGLTKVINPRAGFLHDGRARTLEEAILWHGGESKLSRELFTKLSKSQRDSLISFLKSL
tara:strand:+ start:3491 stop:4990 length:1500 start_codon:yes stop_codon:yes gene_type:complete